jgi:phospholipid-binding lipoprotein MlaA
MPTNSHRLACLVAAAVLAATVTGCATAPDRSDAEAYAEYQAINDPLEPLNKTVFDFNQTNDAIYIRPLTDFYRMK